MASVKLTQASVHKMIDSWAETTGETARLVRFDDPSARSDRRHDGNFFLGKRCYSFTASMGIGESPGEYGTHATRMEFVVTEIYALSLAYALWMATASENARDKVTSNG